MSQQNAEYQFIVDSRGVNSTTIKNNEAIAYVFVTGRSGTSGKYTCRSIKAAVNVLNPSNTIASTAGNVWGTPVTNPTPPPTTTQNVSFTITGGSGAKGGGSNGIFGFFKGVGGAGGLGGTVTGNFTAPADFPTAPTTPIYFGTEVGDAGSLGTNLGLASGPGTTGGGTGFGSGGGGRTRAAGEAEGASAVCVMPTSRCVAVGELHIEHAELPYGSCSVGDHDHDGMCFSDSGRRGRRRSGVFSFVLSPGAPAEREARVLPIPLFRQTGGTAPIPLRQSDPMVVRPLRLVPSEPVATEDGSPSQSPCPEAMARDLLLEPVGMALASYSVATGAGVAAVTTAEGEPV